MGFSNFFIKPISNKQQSIFMSKRQMTILQMCLNVKDLITSKDQPDDLLST